MLTLNFDWDHLVDSHTSPCRVYSLQRLTECAYHNLGRIRLVWGRLWTAMAPHLVSAACHADPGVAAYAVDSLRQLVAKLLAKAERSELTVFMHQVWFMFLMVSCRVVEGGIASWLSMCALGGFALAGCLIADRAVLWLSVVIRLALLPWQCPSV